MILDLTQHKSNALQQPDINNDICFSRQNNTGDSGLTEQHLLLEGGSQEGSAVL